MSGAAKVRHPGESRDLVESRRGGQSRPDPGLRRDGGLGRLALLLCVLALPNAANAATVTTARYGTTRDGRAVQQVTLRNDSGMTVKLISYGAAVTDVIVPARHGRAA